MERHALSRLNNEQVLSLYREGDPAAFDEFFRRNDGLVFNYLLSRLKSRPDAEDAFQRTFLRVHKYVVTYRPSESAIAWVMTIARNVVHDVWRERANMRMQGADSVRPTARDEAAALEARSTLERLAAELTPAEARLLELRFLTEAGYDEIAAAEGISEAGARQRVSRLVRRLTEVIEPTRRRSSRPR